MFGQKEKLSELKILRGGGLLQKKQEREERGRRKGIKRDKLISGVGWGGKGYVLFAEISGKKVKQKQLIQTNSFR